MKLFSLVTDWFSALLGKLSFLEGKAAKAAKDFFNEVNGLLPYALDAVEWVGDVVLSAIQTSHLPIDEIITGELQKIAPNTPLSELRIQAAKLAIKDRDEMLLGLAVVALKFAGFSSAKLRVLKAACDVAYGIYAAQKGK